MIKRIIFMIGIIGTTGYLFAQASLPPFVSRFTAVASESGIRLSWKDVDEAEGDYHVYRHTAEITDKNFDDAELLGIVQKDIEFYNDIPPIDTPYYYAVLASDADGKTYSLLVPYRNKTTSAVINYAPIEVATEEPPAEPEEIIPEQPPPALEEETDTRIATTTEESIPVETPDTEEAASPVISPAPPAVPSAPAEPAQTDTRRRRVRTSPVPIEDLTATVQNIDIVLEYTANEPGDVVIYRSTEPILSQEDLINAIMVETIPSSETIYKDAPLAGVPYYYGVFADRLLRSGGIQFAPGTNVIAQPVSIPLTEETTAIFEGATVRVQPLPFLILSTTIDTGERLQSSTFDIAMEPRELRPETAAAVRALLKDFSPNAKPPISGGLLQEDSAEGILHDVLGDSLENGDWSSAKDILVDFLKIRRPDDIEQKAHYYLGQCLFFLQSYEESFMEFIFAEDGHYAEVQPWMDEVIARLSADR